MNPIARMPGARAAADYLEKSIRVARTIGHREWATANSWNLGDLLMDQGDLANAVAWSLGLGPRTLTVLRVLARLHAALAILRATLPLPTLDAAMRRGRELALSGVVPAISAVREVQSPAARAS